MTASSLPAALRAGADGIYTLEAAAGPIIAQAPGSPVPTTSAASSAMVPARPRSTGKPPSTPCMQAVFRARPENAGCSASQPAWPVTRIGTGS